MFYCNNLWIINEFELPNPVIQVILNKLPDKKTGFVCQNGVMEGKNIWCSNKSVLDICKLILIGLQW